MKTRSYSWLWALWLVVVSIGFAPAMVLINNPESPRPWTALLVVMGVASLGLLARLTLTRVGLDGRGATYAVALTGFLIMNTGKLIGPLTRWGTLALAVVVGAVAYRLRGLRVFEFLVTWACLALTVGPVAILIQNTLTGGETAEVGVPVEVPAFTATPDVVLIVADGYGSNDVLSEFYNFDNSVFEERLASFDMRMNPSMRSNYARTKFSVSSMVQLDYIPVGTPVTPAFESRLVDTMGGDNHLADVMRANGYRTVYLESGWLGTRCAEVVDICVPGPWPDETFYDIAYRSVFRDLPGLEYGIAFSRGSIHSMSALPRDLQRHLTDSVPDFIYVHLLIPHPPFFIDESCRLQPQISMAGFSVGFPDQTDAAASARRAGYIRQLICANDFLAQTVKSISEAKAVSLLFGDHGPDQARQLFIHADQWTDEQKSERFGILFAAHHPGCDYGDVSTLVNAGRRLLSCLSGSDLPSLPDRYFEVDKRSAPPVMMEMDPPAEWGQ